MPAFCIMSPAGALQMLYEAPGFMCSPAFLMKGLIIISASLTKHGPAAEDSGLPEIRRFLRIIEISLSRHISLTRGATKAGPQLWALQYFAHQNLPCFVLVWALVKHVPLVSLEDQSEVKKCLVSAVSQPRSRILCYIMEAGRPPLI